MNTNIHHTVSSLPDSLMPSDEALSQTAPEEPSQGKVVIIGAGLTGLTAAFHLRRNGREVHVVEAADRIGGQICTHREGEYIMESGPNTGVVSYPEVAELFDALKDECQLETAHESSKRRLIWKGNRFHELPSGPISALRTPLFSWYDKFRILGEPFRAKGTNPDETIGQMVVRRLGQSYLKYAVDPFVSGIYAGNPMTLVTRYSFPKLYQLERDYGGFIRGSIAKAKEPKTDRDRLASKKVFSVRGGLGQLTQAMARAIGEEHITTGADQVQVHPCEYGYRVSYTAKDGRQHVLSCQKVITTCAAYALPDVLPFVDQSLMNHINNLFYAPIVQVAVGIKNTQGVRFEAFGGLVPSCEQQNILGILYPSACFEGRAPEQGAMLSFFIGGARHPEYIDKTDEELVTMVEEALHHMLKLPSSVHPDTIRIFRHRHAIPQYELNSGARLAAIDAVERQYPGLFLAGNLKGGIGIADRIRQAVMVANMV